MTTQASMQQVKTFKTHFPESINPHYLLYLPRDYDPQQGQRWPFILFLHGACERGRDVARVKLQGLPKILEYKVDFPFIVISPQCSPNNRWSTDVLNAVLVEALKRCVGNVRFTVYPEAEHDSWTETYENPELYSWFLEHVRQDASFPA